MALVGISRPDRHLDPAGEVPVVLGIALDVGKRERLTTLLDGVGVVMFSPDVATAQAMLGRRPAPGPGAATAGDVRDQQVIRLGDLEVDPVRCRARWRKAPLALTKRDRDLLACLVAEPARVWTYRQLHAVAWNGSYLAPGPVHAAMKRLRRKLREAGVPVRLDAVRGVGYQLVEMDDR